MDPWYVVLVGITLISAIVSLIFAVLAVRDADEDRERRTVALYAAARSFALLVVAIIPAFGYYEVVALLVAAAMTIVQALDALVGIRRGRALFILGPAALGVLNLIAILLYLTVPR